MALEIVKSGGGLRSIWDMSRAIEDCIPEGKSLMAGWTLDAKSVTGSLKGEEVNLRPRFKTSTSVGVNVSLDRLTTVLFFSGWGLVSLRGPEMCGTSTLGVWSICWRNAVYGEVK